MADTDLIAQIPALIEKGGLPAVVGGALLALLYKFGRKESPDTQLAEALKELTAKVGQLQLQVVDRLGRVETRCDNLESKK